MTVIGLKRLKGNSKRTGQPVDGCLIYFVFAERDTEGHACGSEFVPVERMPEGLKVTDEIMILYDRDQRVYEVRRECGA